MKPDPLDHEKKNSKGRQTQKKGIMPNKKLTQLLTTHQTRRGKKAKRKNHKGTTKIEENPANASANTKRPKNSKDPSQSQRRILAFRT